MGAVSELPPVTCRSRLLRRLDEQADRKTLSDAGFGSLDEVLDVLLDQEGLEVDPLDRLELDTPLHKAVRFVNGLAKAEWESGASLVELLLDAGSDPRFVSSSALFNISPGAVR